MATADEAQLAIENLNNTEVQGQTITVEKVQLMNCVLLHSACTCHSLFIMCVFTSAEGDVCTCVCLSVYLSARLLKK